MFGVAATLLMLVLVMAPGVSAHKPLFETGDTSGYADAVEVPDPEISWAAYGYLDSGEDTDYYFFDIKGPLNVYTELLVPEKKAYDNFYPSYAIVGPGLASPAGLPFTVPDSSGAIVVDSPPGPRGTFYEPFTGINYYRGVRKYTMLTEPGRYFIVVYDRNRTQGDYVLAVGEKEAFGAGDIPGVLASVIKIRSGGVDHSEAAAR